MSAEIERLESKVAYLERATNELSDVVYAQQREIERLRESFKALVARLEVSKEDFPAPASEQERPPHY
jgi:SlyX protein